MLCWQVVWPNNSKKSVKINGYTLGLIHTHIFRSVDLCSRQKKISTLWQPALNLIDLMTSEIDRLPKRLWFRQFCALKVDSSYSVNIKQDTDGVQDQTTFCFYIAIIRYHLALQQSPYVQILVECISWYSIQLHILSSPRANMFSIAQSICTHYSCFENMGRFVTLKKNQVHILDLIFFLSSRP